MMKPTIEELTGGKFNRYELVVGVAKCARIVTDEYIQKREQAQRMIQNRETEKPLLALIPSEYKDQKPVRLAITQLKSGRFKLSRKDA